MFASVSLVNQTQTQIVRRCGERGEGEAGWTRGGGEKRVADRDFRSVFRLLLTCETSQLKSFSYSAFASASRGWGWVGA